VPGLTAVAVRADLPQTAEIPDVTPADGRPFATEIGDRDKERRVWISRSIVGHEVAIERHASGDDGQAQWSPFADGAEPRRSRPWAPE
jgi:hypothetical protein